ncbi:Outer membrane protein beta-barrel domain-containing protein [Salinimicrobium sediminis]|uniref:Outer membrane protein beta-barrel domain-containing protein n=1 Tax=Salinimicrobium sediminis TaxID=1343891 RepID=A0A285X313_9FLAO|nr:outer membrane beta-barrel protein [Salinimicrobium sediminis]SOC79416.1 Outer membrane protein beta-barrel domain-containing protein [Salinimicrobium sediminis]
MDLKRILLLGIVLIFSFSAQAQRRLWDGEYNRLGLQAGANYFNIVTNDLEVQPKVSWTAGFTTRASFYENWQFVYGINFYDFKLDIDGREKVELTSPIEAIEYNMIGVQGNFFASYKLIDHYLSVEAGPVLQVNGKLDARQDKELWFVGNTNVNAIDIEKISPFNVNLALGLSGGMETVKFWAQYQYGLNNMLKGLEDEGLEEKDAGMSNLEGHMSMIAAGITMFL